MTDETFALAQSLELIVARHGDPVDAIYRRLFAVRPEVERLFVMDRQGLARGNMLAVFFDAVMDVERGGSYGLNLLAAERTTHDALGVDRQAYAAFFGVVRDTVRELSGDGWTPAMEAAWTRILSAVQAGEGLP
jgi:hemoglobin-like flavoprotein